MKNTIYFHLNSCFLLKRTAVFIVLFIGSFSQALTQNVGIGVNEPTEKLQVNGIVHSLVEGFRFPDGSVQHTASSIVGAEDAGDNRWIIILKIVSPFIPGSFNFDTLQMVVKVIDYQWGLTNIPQPDGSSELTVNSLQLTKNIDLATNPLLIRAINGEIMGEMRMYFYRPAEGGMQLYYKLIMHEIIITAFDQKMLYKGGEDFAHLDVIGLQFGEGYWEYYDGVFGNFISVILP